MRLGMIGTSYLKASVAEREKLHLTDAEQADFYKRMQASGIQEICLLITCGRMEIYYVSEDSFFERDTCTIIQALQKPCSDMGIFQKLSDEKCLKHLMRVASGLDSVVIGEDQILGQVKNAMILSDEKGCCGKYLHKAFREAITWSKKIKTMLKISEVPLSLSYVAIKKAQQFGIFSPHARITIVGMGEMGELALKYVLEHPFSHLTICVRHTEKLPQWILTHPKVHIEHFEKRYQWVATSDLVISATGAPHTVLRQDSFRSETRKKLIIDLAMPRDVDVELGEKDGITLWNIDGLNETLEDHAQKRHQLASEAEKLLEEATDELMLWIKKTEIDGLIFSWHEEIENIKKQGLQRMSKAMKSSDGLSDQVIESILDSLLKKMIKKPIENLKKMDCDHQRKESVDVLKALYGDCSQG